MVKNLEKTWRLKQCQQKFSPPSLWGCFSELPRWHPPWSAACRYYWTDPYYGTPFENVAPYTAYGQPDPYRGTVFDNVAPY